MAFYIFLRSHIVFFQWFKIIYLAEGEVEDTAEPSVTYQIIAQQMTDDGQMQLTLSDGVNIIQTTMALDQLHSK